jgi:TIR domain
MTADRKIIIDILRDSLEAGESVEIEGLGTFRKVGSSHYGFSPQTQPQVFVAYVAEDLVTVRRLCRALAGHSFSLWLDQDKLLPGQNWPRAIQRAIETADVFVACFSARAVSKRGQFQSELRYALDCARNLPLDATFLIPIRLEPCDVPRKLAEQLHWVDLFPDWDRGIKRLALAIRREMRGRSTVCSRLVVAKRPIPR